MPRGGGACGVRPTCPPPSSPHGEDLEQPPGMRQPPLVHAEEARRAIGAHRPHVQLRVVQRPGQGSDQTCAPPPSQPPTWGARVPEEAHLLAAEPRHPGVGARGAKQAPRALCLVEHREPSVRRADLHCRARGPPGSPSRPSPPGLFSARASLVPSPGRPDRSTLRSARL